ncbi:glypican-1 [Protopterus annectens]|uniref:glypican-1 n=1 Tax=Protopterus annectens TaxID=7888 RepID=UPI001CFC4389|nr:glypican-1 [Protopterus annectens]
MDLSGLSWFLLGSMLWFCFWIPTHCNNVPNGPKSCSELRQLYTTKGFSPSGVPPKEISGEHLRICPQGYTCCTSEIEENLANKSRSEFEGMVKEAGRSVQLTLVSQHKVFDAFFQEVLNKSEKSLQENFPAMYGELYSQNVKLFKDIYGELRRYHRGSNINLEEALNEFWARLLERLFKQLNPQHQITDEYLDCMLKHAEQHHPFGEVPRELKLRATRAFIAVRSFVQGLSLGGDVIRKVSQVPLSPECTRAIMKLVYCPHCRGLSSVKPCSNYCHNVMKGCLANQADLDAEWKNLVESMLQVADRFETPASVEMVIGTVHIKISEAITILEENKDHFTSKVFQGCGNLKVTAKGSGNDDKKKRGKQHNEEKFASPSGLQLEKLVSDVKVKLRDIKDYWVALPNALCNERIAATPSNEDKCWNGMTKSRYLPEVMGDGLANQINNPEVEVDITKPDSLIRQQILQLKIMTNRLKNAYNGNDVDFQDASDDISGSGSGDGCSEQACVGGSSRRSNNLNPAGSGPELKQTTQSKNEANSKPIPTSLLFSFVVVFLAVQNHRR